jgi:hypothetical protein
MQQKNLFGWDDPPTRYPAMAGAKVSSGPSAEAAEKIAWSTSRLRSLVLGELGRWPAGRTADEIAHGLCRSPLSIRPRLSELKALGKVMSTGQRRLNESGMSATVWALSEVTSDVSSLAASDRGPVEAGGNRWKGWHK